MQKLAVVVLSGLLVMHSCFGMEELVDIQRKKYVGNELIGSFMDKVVLDYDGDPEKACYIAQTAKMVHSDIRGKNATDIATMQEKYAHVKNLIFTKPQSNFYDVVTVYNANILSRKTMLSEIANFIKPHLKLNGEIHALVRTQKHCPSIEEDIFLTFYPRIYELLSAEQKEELKQEWAFPPSVTLLQKQLLTEDKVKDYIWSGGYDIISYEEIVHEEIMHRTEIEKILKSGVLALLEVCEFSEEIKKSLCSQYLSLMHDKYKINDIGDVIVPTNAIKICLSNKGSMRLRLNFNLAYNFNFCPEGDGRR